MKEKNSASNKLLWYFLAAAAFGVVLIWAFMPAAVKVELAQVKYDKFIQFIEEDAKTRATKIYTITAPVTGKLLRINLTEGDIVKKDETIAVIQPSTPTLLDVRTEQELQQELGQAQAVYEQNKAELERAKAALDTAQSDLKRKEPLAKIGYVSKSEFEHVQLELNLRQKEYDAAVLKLHGAEHNIEKIKTTLSGVGRENNQTYAHVNVVSPVTGRILRIILKSETTLTAGTTIMEIADIARLEIVADILSTDAAQIPPHAKVIIKRWGGPYTLDGRVRIIEPSAFTKISALGVEEQRVNVIIDITSPQALWKNLGDAYRVDVEVILFESDHALVVPMSAVFRDGNNWAVYVARNNRAYKKTVTIKWHNPDQAVVEEGLREGDSVVLYPSSLIHDGVRIKQ